MYLDPNSPSIPQALHVYADRFAELRHRIHANPELGADLPHTSQLVAGLLR